MNWEHPIISGNPWMVAWSFQVAALQLLTNPANYK